MMFVVEIQVNAIYMHNSNTLPVSAMRGFIALVRTLCGMVYE